jgi:ABC-2 type transport system permease protein
MSALLRCFRQTLRGIFRQKETLTLLVGASVLYAFFYPTPYLNQVLRDLPVVVVDRDHTALSRQLSRWLDASEVTCRPHRIRCEPAWRGRCS